MADRSRLQPFPLVPLPDPRRDPAHLPTPLTSFVGREREVAAVAATLSRPGVRLVTLTGPGGVGKTRLAIRVAQEMGDTFPDGIWLAALASVRDPSLIVGTVAQVLGVTDTGARSVEVSLREYLRDRRVLLVLDNFEQVLDAGPWVTELLVACQSVTALVTSRAVLRVAGEHVFSVPPLDVPPVHPDLDAAPPAETEAIRLFLERAGAAGAEIEVTEANVAIIAEVCARLDGLPLAIELAAARARHLSPAALLAHLEPRLPLLTGGNRDQPARLQTMRDAIAWSHDLLTPAEHRLFRRLAVFMGGFTLEAADAVCASPVLDGVASLVDKSILRHIDGPNGEPRYVMLETIREFALEQLVASGEAEEFRRRHGAYYLRFAETVAGSTSGVLLSPNPPLVIARIEADLDNVRATLVWANEHGEVETLLRLLSALGVFWALGGHMAEARTWFDRALSMGRDAPPNLRAPALREAAWVARDQGDFMGASAFAQTSLDLFRALDDPLGQSEALQLVGLAAEDRGDLQNAQNCFEQAMAVLKPLEEHFWSGVLTFSLGRVALQAGDLDLATHYLDDALAKCRAMNNLHIELGVRAGLSEIALLCGKHDEAAMHLVRHFEHSYDVRRLPETLNRSARIAVAGGMYVAAARLLGAAEAAHQRLGIVLVPRHREEVETAAAAARSALGDAAYVAARDGGRALSPSDAAAEAAAALTALAAPAEEDSAPVLTRREREIFRLVAEGHTDREIASVLSIGERTVEWHLTNVFNKLGVNTRTAAATAALRRGLI